MKIPQIAHFKRQKKLKQFLQTGVEIHQKSSGKPDPHQLEQFNEIFASEENQRLDDPSIIPQKTEVKVDQPQIQTKKEGEQKSQILDILSKPYSEKRNLLFPRYTPKYRRGPYKKTKSAFSKPKKEPLRRNRPQQYRTQKRIYIQKWQQAIKNGLDPSTIPLPLRKNPVTPRTKRGPYKTRKLKSKNYESVISDLFIQDPIVQEPLISEPIIQDPVLPDLWEERLQSGKQFFEDQRVKQGLQLMQNIAEKPGEMKKGKKAINRRKPPIRNNHTESWQRLLAREYISFCQSGNEGDNVDYERFLSWPGISADVRKYIFSTPKPGELPSSNRNKRRFYDVTTHLKTLGLLKKNERKELIWTNQITISINDIPRRSTGQAFLLLAVYKVLSSVQRFVPILLQEVFSHGQEKMMIRSIRRRIYTVYVVFESLGWLRRVQRVGQKFYYERTEFFPFNRDEPEIEEPEYDEDNLFERVNPRRSQNKTRNLIIIDQESGKRAINHLIMMNKDLVNDEVNGYSEVRESYFDDSGFRYRLEDQLSPQQWGNDQLYESSENI